MRTATPTCRFLVIRAREIWGFRDGGVGVWIWGLGVVVWGLGFGVWGLGSSRLRV